MVSYNLVLYSDMLTITSFIIPTWYGFSKFLLLLSSIIFVKTNENNYVVVKHIIIGARLYFIS
jgi:hypothetical protein